MIIQKSFHVPDAAVAAIQKGECYTSGLVLRSAAGSHKGQIVAICDQVGAQTTIQKTKVLLAKSLQMAKVHPGITVCVFFGVGATGALIGLVRREPRVFKEFRVALKEYLQAVNEGSVSLELIGRLLTALQKAKQHRKYATHTMELTVEEVNTLVSMLQEHALQSAKDDVAAADDIISTADDSNVIIDLEQYLRTQQEAHKKIA